MCNSREFEVFSNSGIMSTAAKPKFTVVNVNINGVIKQLLVPMPAIGSTQYVVPDVITSGVGQLSSIIPKSSIAGQTNPAKPNLVTSATGQLSSISPRTVQKILTSSIPKTGTNQGTTQPLENKKIIVVGGKPPGSYQMVTLPYNYKGIRPGANVENGSIPGNPSKIVFMSSCKPGASVLKPTLQPNVVSSNVSSQGLKTTVSIPGSQNKIIVVHPNAAPLSGGTCARSGLNAPSKPPPPTTTALGVHREGNLTTVYLTENGQPVSVLSKTAGKSNTNGNTEPAMSGQIDSSNDGYSALRNLLESVNSEQDLERSQSSDQVMPIEICPLGDIQDNETQADLTEFDIVFESVDESEAFIQELDFSQFDNPVSEPDSKKHGGSKTGSSTQKAKDNDNTANTADSSSRVQANVSDVKLNDKMESNISKNGSKSSNVKQQCNTRDNPSENGSQSEECSETASQTEETSDSSSQSEDTSDSSSQTEVSYETTSQTEDTTSQADTVSQADENLADTVSQADENLADNVSQSDEKESHSDEPVMLKDTVSQNKSKHNRSDEILETDAKQQMGEHSRMADNVEIGKSTIGVSQDNTTVADIEESSTCQTDASSRDKPVQIVNNIPEDRGTGKDEENINKEVNPTKGNQLENLDLYSYLVGTKPCHKESIATEQHGMDTTGSTLSADEGSDANTEDNYVVLAEWETESQGEETVNDQETIQDTETVIRAFDEGKPAPEENVCTSQMLDEHMSGVLSPVGKDKSGTSSPIDIITSKSIKRSARKTGPKVSLTNEELCQRQFGMLDMSPKPVRQWLKMYPSLYQCRVVTLNLNLKRKKSINVRTSVILKRYNLNMKKEKKPNYKSSQPEATNPNIASGISYITSGVSLLKNHNGVQYVKETSPDQPIVHTAGHLLPQVKNAPYVIPKTSSAIITVPKTSIHKAPKTQHYDSDPPVSLAAKSGSNKKYLMFRVGSSKYLVGLPENMILTGGQVNVSFPNKPGGAKIVFNPNKAASNISSHQLTSQVPQVVSTGPKPIVIEPQPQTGTTVTLGSYDSLLMAQQPMAASNIKAHIPVPYFVPEPTATTPAMLHIKSEPNSDRFGNVIKPEPRTEGYEDDMTIEPPPEKIPKVNDAGKEAAEARKHRIAALKARLKQNEVEFDEVRKKREQEKSNISSIDL